MLIRVTQEHIDEGECHRCYCPIALAIKDILNVPRFPSEQFVEVNKKSITLLEPLSGRDGDRTKWVPEVAEKFIEQFDGWKTQQNNNYSGPDAVVCPEPFEFELEV